MTTTLVSVRSGFVLTLPLPVKRGFGDTFCGRSGMILMRANSDDAYSLTHLKSQLEREWAARCREAGRLRSAKTDPLLELSVGEWASSSLYATRLSSIPLDRCFIADSLLPGAGRGVFAKTAMAAGSLATLYPGDAVRLAFT